MFIWDFVASTVMDNLIDWLYGQTVGFLGNLFSVMGNMGVEAFELEWVQATILFFSQLDWALYGMNLVMCAFEFGIKYATGWANLQHTTLGTIKSLLAVNLFAILPVRLYALFISLWGRLSARLIGYGTGIGGMGQQIITDLDSMESIADMTQVTLDFGFGVITSPIMLLFCVILMAHAMIKVFFADLKRGGILLIQIAVGSLCMFSIPRGHVGGFVQWIKQVIDLCLTTFLQSTILVADLTVFKDHTPLGLGLMLSAEEVPRVAGTFGLDTTTRANIISTVYTAQAAVNTTRTVATAVAPKQKMNMTGGTEFHPPRIYTIWVDARPESPLAGLSGFLSGDSRRLLFTERKVTELKIRDIEALRLNRYPAAEYRCVEYPGRYDAERNIQAELLRTISLQADPEIMRYEVTGRIYDNTGGDCIVGTLAVHLPGLDETVQINCNDEDVTITTVDYAWNEGDSGSWERYEDVIMFEANFRDDDPRFMWPLLPAIHEALAYTVQRETEYSFRLFSIPAE